MSKYSVGDKVLVKTRDGGLKLVEIEHVWKMNSIATAYWLKGHYGMLPESEIVWKVSEEDEEA